MFVRIFLAFLVFLLPHSGLAFQDPLFGRFRTFVKKIAIFQGELGIFKMSARKFLAFLVSLLPHCGMSFRYPLFGRLAVWENVCPFLVNFTKLRNSTKVRFIQLRPEQRPGGARGEAPSSPRELRGAKPREAPFLFAP